MPAGTLMFGAVVSCTVTLKSSKKTGASRTSLAVHLTVAVVTGVVIGNVVPDGGAQSTVNAGSVVGSFHVTTAPEEDVASTNWSGGKVIQRGLTATAAGVTSSAVSVSRQTRTPRPPMRRLPRGVP
jgi:hypothetical protein